MQDTAQEMLLEELRSKKGFICDMDGVIYHGNRLLPGVREFVDWLYKENKRFLFLTNSSERSPKELQQKLARMGLDVDESHFYTSALATAKFLKYQAPGCSAYVIGAPGLVNALYDAGITMDMKMEQLDEICTASGATDVLEADERVWKIRRNCLEATRVLSKVSTSDDLVVPVDKIAVCIEHLTEVSKNYSFKLFTLAHAGDGNLHFQILKGDMSDEQWADELQRFHAEAYAYVYSLGGRLSGEHGIGAKKLPAMETYTNPVEMQIMRSIKHAMDPNNILNPGKVFNA